MKNSDNPTAGSAGIDLDRLEQLARAAAEGAREIEIIPNGPGHGRRVFTDRIEVKIGMSLVACAHATNWSRDGKRDMANMQLIAALNPTTVLALIEQARRATPQHSGTEQADDMKAAVDAAMVEMANIYPPLRRSDCARLIRAALAIPASTAPTQPESEKANVAPPFAAPAAQHDAGWIGKISAGEYDPETGTMYVTVKLPFAGLPEELRTINAMARIAPASTAASEQRASGSEGESLRMLEILTGGLWIERAAEENSRVADMLREARAIVVRHRAALSGRATIPSEADERALRAGKTLIEFAHRIGWAETDDEGAFERALRASYEQGREDAALTHRATTAEQQPAATTASASEPFYVESDGVEHSHPEYGSGIFFTLDCARATAPSRDAAAGIKTWQVRCNWSSAEPATKLMVEAMKDEIADLRAALAQQGAAQAQAGDVARDAARYRVLREHVAPRDVSISMQVPVEDIPPNQSIEERIDMLCDQLVGAAMSAPATSKENA